MGGEYYEDLSQKTDKDRSILDLIYEELGGACELPYAKTPCIDGRLNLRFQPFSHAHPDQTEEDNKLMWKLLKENNQIREEDAEDPDVRQSLMHMKCNFNNTESPYNDKKRKRDK